jgi:putative transposase
MTNYRRTTFAGGTFFFTVNLADRRLSLLTERIDLLRAAFRYAPEHLHAMWTLPDGDADFAVRWRLIKSTFSRGLPRRESLTTSRVSKGERGIWQRRYWEHAIRDDADYAGHADYIHFNPVKHGYVSRVRDWPYSSFRRMARAGSYPLDGAGDMSAAPTGFGER